MTMLGAVAARAAASRRSTPVQDAAVEVLGGKVDPDEVRAAVSEGYACLR